jgi:hypothetical protein
MTGDSGGRKHFITKQPERMYSFIGIVTRTLAIVNLSV